MSKDTNLQIQETEQSSNTINSGKPRSKHIMLKFLKTKYKEEILKAVEKHDILLIVINHWNDKGFCTRHYGGQKKVAQHLLHEERKEPSVQNSISIKTFFRNEDEIQMFSEGI